MNRRDYERTQKSISTHVIKPIVTESPEEANNNDVVNCRRAINKSTVEILEVPHRQKIYGNFSNPTFTRQTRQLFYENNTYATPVVTSATDDENGDQSDDDVALPTETEVESILNDSSIHQPPRTSTPHSSRNESTINHMSYVSVVRDEEDEETIDDSRDTDELTNTSAHNQSGGCLLVGINDISATSWKESHGSSGNSQQQQKLPYTVQVFNDTTMSSAVSSPTRHNGLRHEAKQETDKHHLSCIQKFMEMEKITSSLVSHIEKLNDQVLSLSSRVDELETDLQRQQKEVKVLKDGRLNSYSADKQSKCISPPNSMLNPSFTQSSCTINKLGYGSPNSGHPSNPMSTYSRKHVAAISRTPNNSTSQTLSSSVGNNSANNRLPYSHSSTNTATKPLGKTPVHASTNFLYADSLKSCSTSISPIPNYGQSVSPTSMMNLSSRRDPSVYTSMLSLSSLNPSCASTLKKGFANSGSIFNVSQIGDKLSNWPSMNDFVAAKHRAKDILYSANDRTIHMSLYNRLMTIRLPTWADSNYDLDRPVEAPSIQLKLNWVHGYRGRDCRSNIFFLPTGECVYFVASVIVLYNPTEKTQRHYLGHTDNVKCLAVHPNKLHIASGQSSVQNRKDRRPIVRVWNAVSLATMRVIEFNEDLDRSICCLAFSKHDQGATLAVVDESNEHTITLLDWQKEKNWRIAEANSGHEPVLAIDFHPIDKYSLVAVGKASINFWDVRGMSLNKRAGLFDKYDKPKYVSCLTFNDNGDTITGDSNGSIIIWSRGNNRPSRVIHDAHHGGVLSVLAMKDGSYLTGGRDRRIIEWDENFSRTGREAELPEHCGGVRYMTYARGSQVLVGTLRNSILIGSLDKNFTLVMQGHSEAISSLAMHPTENQYLTGGFDEQIHLFDTKTHEPIWTKCLMMPATAAGFSPNGQLLIVGSTFGKWLVVDATTQEILFTKCDGSGTINCIKFSPDGEYFSMGSSDFQIYVYQTNEVGNKFCRIGTCVGHTAPVKEIDWSDDSRYMQTQSLNFELLFWNAHNCRPLEELDIIDDLRWFTHNCTIGFGAIGLWSDSIDSALINYCDRSNNEDLLVSVTDTGFINIFRWPACYNQCSYQKFHGNVEKFNYIKFLPDDSGLIAVGAKNCVTTEWIVVDKGEPMDTS